MIVDNITDYLKEVKGITDKWFIKADPWFRGENISHNPTRYQEPLLPKVFQERYKDRENEMIQMFRMKANNYGNVPEFSRTDLWLFLMQHCGLPTRLLDWTEGSLIALFFAINRFEEGDIPIVWVLNPLILNFLSFSSFEFNLTWKGYKAKHPVSIGNISAAFTLGQDKYQSDFPIAIYPHSIHPRISAQRGCFTVHGKCHESLDKILKNLNINSIMKSIQVNKLEESAKRFNFNNYYEVVSQLKKSFSTTDCLYRIDINTNETEKGDMLHELKTMGVSYETLFPDLDGLAQDIKLIKNNNSY